MENNTEFLKYIRKGSINAINSLNHSIKSNKNMTISANLMVKNEERCIKRCIDSIVDYVDEINVVDTGSTDKTLSILDSLKNNYGKLKIYKHTWNDNFSEIRNYMLSISSGDVIFMLDADESLKHNISVCEFRNIINKIFSSMDNNILVSPILYDADGTTSDKLARIYRNDSSIYYFGCVHEEVRSRIYKSFEFISTNITLFHDGYDQAQIVSKDKINRNIKLLKKTLIIEENNYRWYFFLMRDLYSSKVYNEELLNIAYTCLKKIESSCKNINEYRKQSYIYISLIFLKFRKFQQLKNIIDRMYSLYPGDIDCFYIKLESTKVFCKHIIFDLISEFNQIDRTNEFDLVLNIDFDTIVMDLFWNTFYTKQCEIGFLLLSELKDNNKIKILEDVEKIINSITEKVLKYKDPDIYFKDMLNKNCIMHLLK